MSKITINDRELSREEKEQIYISISVRLMYIETGTINRAHDLQRSDKNFKPRILTKEQRELIIMLENLMEEMFQ